MYPDPILPRAHPDLLSRVDYDPFEVMPGNLPAGPRVFVTAPQIAGARARIKKGVPADVHCLALLIANTKINEPLPDLKSPTAPADWGGGTLVPPLKAAFKNALAWRLTDDPRHHQRALEAMRLAAHGCARTVQWASSTHHESCDAAYAYDLLSATGLTPEDDNLFREMLNALVVSCDACKHLHCNNHNSMQMTGRLSLGIALGNRQVIHDTLYGCQREGKWRYGLIHLLRHDFLADGMHWEGVPGYHMLVLMMVCECFTLMENIGVNLWHRSWPSTMRDEGFDEHASYGPRGNKPLTAAFDALIFQAFANGDYCLLHDQVLGNLRGSWAWWPIFNKAYDTYRFPRYAWALQHSNNGQPATENGPIPAWFTSGQADINFVRFETRTFPSAPAPHAQDLDISITGKHQSGCTLFPAHGSALLRSDAGNPAALGSYFYWGPHIAGHRSPASLHLDIHALGERAAVAPHIYAEGYETPVHLTWFRTTVAHNTVSVDGQSMFPYDFETQSVWEYELWRDTSSQSTLETHQLQGSFKAIRASNDSVYKGVKLDRTVVLTQDYVLDIYRVTADRARTFDWTMHCHGQFPPSAAPSIDLGTARGYRHFTDARLLATGGGFTSVPYQFNNAPALASVWLQGAPGAQLILTKDPIPDNRQYIGDRHPSQPRTCLMVRANAPSALFVSVWSFGGKQAQGVNVQGGPDSDIQVTVNHDNQTHHWSAPKTGNITLK